MFAIGNCGAHLLLVLLVVATYSVPLSNGGTSYLLVTITISYLSQISFAPIYSVGVSLVLLGQTIPNNSLVNLDDLAYQAPNLAGFTQDP